MQYGYRCRVYVQVVRGLRLRGGWPALGYVGVDGRFQGGQKDLEVAAANAWAGAMTTFLAASFRRRQVFHRRNGSSSGSSHWRIIIWKHGTALCSMCTFGTCLPFSGCVYKKIPEKSKSRNVTVHRHSCGHLYVYLQNIHIHYTIKCCTWTKRIFPHMALHRA